MARDHARDNGVNDDGNVRRRSTRISKQPIRYNLESIKCSVCRRSFRGVLPDEFFSGSKACSAELYSRSVACSVKCLKRMDD